MPLILNKEMPVYQKFEKAWPDSLFKGEIKDGEKVIKILIFNLMKNKVEAEEQFLRCLSFSGHTISVEFLRQTTHKSSDEEYINRFYLTFDEVKDRYFDAMIITGAPLDGVKYEEVHYWDETCKILDWSKEHVKSSFYFCWGAFSGLYHDYNIGFHHLPEKVSGIFRIDAFNRDEKLFEGIEELWIPLSRAMELNDEDIERAKSLIPLAGREGKTPVFFKSADNRTFYSTAHPEYGRDRINFEYNRDKDRVYNYNINVPKHYYPDNNPENEPFDYWIKDSDRLFKNWLDFYVVE